jgi:lipopolysaccharide/colanic/teichoic acid biosynthesis glycosyltransferase
VSTALNAEQYLDDLDSPSDTTEAGMHHAHLPGARDGATSAAKPRLTLVPATAVTHNARTPGLWYLPMKRAFDIAFALVLLLLLSPVCLIAAIVIRRTSRGPVLYQQVRIGEHGKPFTCYKYRTMVPNAHTLKIDLIDRNDTTGPVFKLVADPRIIPIGRFLRKFSIDEIPQLINVIRGDMSIVGPRPPLPEEVDTYDDYQFGRLAVKPGLTCLWQVSGRSHIGFEEWVELDLEYIRRRGFWYDIWMILRTIPAVLTCRGAF